MSTEHTENAVDLANMSIRSFRYDPKKGATSYAITIPTEFGPREFTSPKDSRRPHPDLIKALSALEETLAKYDETKSLADAPVSVLGVTIAEADERVGFKLAGRQAYKRSHGFRPMNPPIRFDDHPDARQQYTKKEIELIDSLIDEIRLYILGKTGEPELFTDAAITENAGGDTVGNPEGVEIVGAALVVDGKKVF